jgi:flagellar biosynthetic protein FliQ
MFQAATQINEQTLSFIPKLFVVLGVLVAAGPWILHSLVNYTEDLIRSIPSLIG